MISREIRRLITELRRHGHSIRKIAAFLGIHRNTVSLILNERSVQYHMNEYVSTNPDSIPLTSSTSKEQQQSSIPEKGHKPINQTISKLDPFKPYLKERVDKYPLLQGSVLFREILERGYLGQYTILKDYLRMIRPSAPPFTQVPFFETEPGEQMQVDFGSGCTLIEQILQRVLYLVFVLGYSRMMYVEFVTNMTLPTLISAHLNAFRYFGGVPKQGLYYNMRQLVRRIEKQKVFTALWQDFASFYDLTTLLQAPYHPQTKGKVERMIPFVRSHLLYGKQYTNLEALEEAKLVFLEEVANGRHHSVLQERPLDRFQTEKECLRPFHKLYPLYRLQERKVREQNDIVIHRRRYFLSACKPGDIVCILQKEQGQYRFFQKATNREIPLQSVCPAIADYEVENRLLQEYESFIPSRSSEQERRSSSVGGGSL